MDKSKKILVISFIPAVLTLLFIVYILVPSMDKMNTSSSDLSKAKNKYEENKTLLNDLQKKVKYNKELEDLKTKLADFDVKIPPEHDLPILLYDLERFADISKVKIASFKAEREKKLKIVDPKEEKKSKKKSSRKKADKKEESPYNFSSVPAKVIITGQYLDTLKFVNILEHYGRTLLIEDITVSENKKSANKSKSEIEMQINLKVFKLVKNELNESESETKDSK